MCLLQKQARKNAASEDKVLDPRMTPALYTESRNANAVTEMPMPDENKSREVLPAQIEGAFTVGVQAHYFGEDVEIDIETETLELFPQGSSIVFSSSKDGAGFGIELQPRVALELAKKLMSMCAAYGEDIGACDPCGELFPMEELHELMTSVGETTACTVCMESGR